jgi:hypothetical protein
MRTMKNTWTLAALQNEAVKYADRTGLRNGNEAAYRAALRAGVLQELLPARDGLNRGPRKWTPEALKTEAAKYDSFKAFALGNQAAYNAAKKHKTLFEKLFERRKIVWDASRLRQVAPLFSSKSEFRNAYPGGYSAALKLGVLDELFNCKSVKWTSCAIKDAASEFGSKSEFAQKAPGAYAAAIRLGLIDELFANKHAYTAADAVYVWAAGGLEYDGKRLVKVGVTSARLGAARIEQCARANGLRPEDVHIKIRSDAKHVEKSILRMRLARPLPWGVQLTDGRSEFRLATPQQYQTMLQVLEP